MTAVTEELGSQVQGGILGFEHNVEFLHTAKFAKSSAWVESRLCLLQDPPCDGVADVAGCHLPIYDI